MSGRRERQDSRVVPRFWQEPRVMVICERFGESRFLGREQEL